MLLITIPDQYCNDYKALQIYTGYFDSLGIMILSSYPSSIIVTRDYCLLDAMRAMYSFPRSVIFQRPRISSDDQASDGSYIRGLSHTF